VIITDFIDFVAQLAGAGIITGAGAFRTLIAGCAEKSVIARVRIVGILAGSSIADVIGTIIRVITVNIIYTIHTFIKAFIASLFNRARITAANASPIGTLIGLSAEQAVVTGGAIGYRLCDTGVTGFITNAIVTLIGECRTIHRVTAYTNTTRTGIIVSTEQAVITGIRVVGIYAGTVINIGITNLICAGIAIITINIFKTIHASIVWFITHLTGTVVIACAGTANTLVVGCTEEAVIAGSAIVYRLCNTSVTVFITNTIVALISESRTINRVTT
jgi:hypothetical protein